MDIRNSAAVARAGVTGRVRSRLGWSVGCPLGWSVTARCIGLAVRIGLSVRIGYTVGIGRRIRGACPFNGLLTTLG